MKFNKLFLALAFSVLLLTLVSAERYEANVFKEGVIKADGSYVQTTTAVNGVSALGFVCSSSGCDSYSGDLWNGNPLTTTTDKLILTYPTQLQSLEGYAIYFYKEGYIPYGLKANYFGTKPGESPENPAGPFTDYMSKKEVCKSNINSLNAIYNPTTKMIEVTSNSAAPIAKAGVLTVIPSALQTYYQTKVGLSLTAVKDGNLFNSQEKTLFIPFSSTKAETFSFQVSPGTYTINLTSGVPDATCLSSLPDSKQVSVVVPNEADNLPPASITNLRATNIGLNFITWNWTNPTDSDFDKVILRINNGNPIEITGNTYTATNLQKITAYSLCAQTKDTSGNINITLVCNTAVTLNDANQNIFVDIISPVQKEYNSNQVLVNISSNASFVWYNYNGTDIEYTSPHLVNFPVGNHTLIAYASNSFGLVVSDSVSFSVKLNNNVGDTTPPGTVTNLRVLDKGKNFIKWTWNNPSDSDFSQAIIYIGNVNVGNITSNTYTATGLNEDTSYTIRINTKDTSGNVNFVNVTNTARTSKSSNGGGDDDDRPVKVLPPKYAANNTYPTPIILEEDTPIKLKTNTSNFNYLLFLVIMLIAGIILLLILIYVLMQRD